MNTLHLSTTPTEDPRVFETCWMTGLSTKGCVRVHIPVEGLGENRALAELEAARFLLISKNACGHKKAGAGLQVYFSCQTILDLVQGVSSKGYLSAYANFLRTRFVGAEFFEERAPDVWVDEQCGCNVDEIDLTGPSMTLIEVSGIGPVELTAHAIEQFIKRFDTKPAKAWRRLSVLASHVHPAHHVTRNIMHDIKHRRPARYYTNPGSGLVLVIAEPDRMDGLPRLVTVTQHDPVMLKTQYPDFSPSKGAARTNPMARGVCVSDIKGAHQPLSPASA